MHAPSASSLVPNLYHLTIKPLTGCALHCPYCISRQETFEASRERRLGVNDWARVFREGDALGIHYLDISGGEPSVYPGLDALVWEAKRLGWFVSMNTSGFRVTPELVARQRAVGLDQVIVSLMSLYEDVHDGIRGRSGNWREALASLAMLRSEGIRVVLHFILSRQNHTELPDLIEFAFRHGVNALALVYPENDHARRDILLTGEDIQDFRTRVLPEAISRYSALTAAGERDLANLAGLFAAHGHGGDFAQGLYWESWDEIRRRCDKPNTFLLIYPNGDVFPCNAVEYTHEPIVGNALEKSLAEIWQGSRIETFRAGRMEFCRLCPIKRHTGISIRTRDNPPYAVPVVKGVPADLPANRPPVRDSVLELQIAHA